MRRPASTTAMRCEISAGAETTASSQGHHRSIKRFASSLQLTNEVFPPASRSVTDARVGPVATEEEWAGGVRRHIAIGLEPKWLRMPLALLSQYSWIFAVRVHSLGRKHGSAEKP